jgi:hypothetical protein
VNIGFFFLGQVVVDDQRNLLNIETSSKQIGSDQYSDFTLSEFSHNFISFFLRGLSVHHFKGESIFLKFLGSFISIFLFIDVDNSLLDLDVFIKFLKSGILPVFLLDSNEKLFDTVQSKIFIFYSDNGRVSHEFLGNFQDSNWHSGRIKSDLNVTGQSLNNFSHLFFESLV